MSAPATPVLFRAIAVKQGLKLLAVGIRPNSAWTPKATLAAAGRITGRAYKQRQYAEAIKDLEEYLTQQGVNS